MRRSLFVLFCGLSACGFFGGGGDVRCDQKNADLTAFTEWRGPTLTQREAITALCSAAEGTFSDGSCNHSNIIAGCTGSQALEDANTWYYPSKAIQTRGDVFVQCGKSVALTFINTDGGTDPGPIDAGPNTNGGLPGPIPTICETTPPGAASRLHIVNLSAGRIEAWSVNAQCVEEPFMALGHNQEITIPTFVTTPWRLRDANPAAVPANALLVQLDAGTTDFTLQ